ncbi:DUF4192 domain-containing protein [Pseudonocardia sp. CA-107938]|uniref:DUF4192 domain-containing protein n=1 Tax=Pseudonocardia sp. CA-107938 TaxID=3240021 RepID=UPI003D918663
MTIPSTTPPRLTEPADLITAVPVLLGFRPRESLVLVTMHRQPSGRHRFGLTLRVDLPAPRHVTAVAAQTADALLVDAAVEAAVIVFGSGPDGRPPGRPKARSRKRRQSGPLRRDVANAAVGALRARGISAHSVMWAQRCAAGAPWACYDGCCSGTLADPGSTPMAAHAVAEGAVVYGDRTELEALVAPVAPAVLRRRARLLATAVLDVGTARQRFDDALAAAARCELRIDDDTVVALAAALEVPEVRDQAILLSAAEDPAAEQLWGALARETPDPQAAVPAALLALAALASGRGALADVALRRAELAWPGHHLTGLVRTASASLVRPEQIRAWFAS